MFLKNRFEATEIWSYTRILKIKCTENVSRDHAMRKMETIMFNLFRKQKRHWTFLERLMRKEGKWDRGHKRAIYITILLKWMTRQGLKRIASRRTPPKKRIGCCVELRLFNPWMKGEHKIVSVFFFSSVGFCSTYSKYMYHVTYLIQHHTWKSIIYSKLFHFYLFSFATR